MVAVPWWLVVVLAVGLSALLIQLVMLAERARKMRHLIKELEGEEGLSEAGEGGSEGEG